MAMSQELHCASFHCSSLAEICEACQEAEDVIQMELLHHLLVVAKDQRLEYRVDLVQALGAVDAQ
eukprot:7021918-Prorocentrum_lima.AAC.1